MSVFIQTIRMLSNFTAGAMLLLFRPFKVGDLIEAAGTFGTVEEIQLFNTIIITPENRYITLSNAQLSSEKITNYSTKGILRLELLFGLVHDDYFLKIKPLLKEILKCDARILKNPAPTVALLEAADSMVTFAVRPYVKVEDYWDVHLDLMEQIKLLFLQEGIAALYSEQTEKSFAGSCGALQPTMRERRAANDNCTPRPAKSSIIQRRRLPLNPLRFEKF